MEMKGCFPKLGYAVTIEKMDQAILDASVESYLASVDRTVADSSRGEAS
jgi:hypothetical protein